MRRSIGLFHFLTLFLFPKSVLSRTVPFLTSQNRSVGSNLWIPFFKHLYLALEVMEKCARASELVSDVVLYAAVGKREEFQKPSLIWGGGRGGTKHVVSASTSHVRG